MNRPNQNSDPVSPGEGPLESSDLEQTKSLDQSPATAEELVVHHQIVLTDSSRGAGSASNFVNDSFALSGVEETAAFDSKTKKETRGSVDKTSQPRSVGDYLLGELLGEGGMGRVFRAEDSSGGVVALKLLSPSLSSSEDAMARFKQEGLIASQINHCHIVFVHRVDEAEGIPFIAMELMTGRTLKDLVLERGPLPYQEAVRLILQCIAGLCEAHARGMIHRDIKPANCYLDEDGNIKVGDFGLARSLIGDSELTQTGTFLGTPLFAAPEQLLGQAVDTRSDIYSLTATLYYLLAGKAPFESPNAAQVIARIASSDPPSFQSVGVDVPEVLEEIVMKGLSRDASKRYASFEEMRHDLQAILAPKPETASLFRRVVAGVADSMLVSTLIGIAVFFSLSLENVSHRPELTGLLTSILMTLYYWAAEAIFGTSIGKAALRIRVADKQTLRKPTNKQCFLRAVTFFAVTQGIVTLAHFVVVGTGTDHAILLATINFWGSMVVYAFCYWVWRKTGRRQLPHDWISNTECVLFASAASPVTELNLPSWRPLSRSSTSPMPVSLGRFRIEREIACPIASDALNKAYRWFEGVDPQLDRAVWIAYSAVATSELDQLQRRKGKFNRIRFIEEGQHEDGRWFAFVVPDGIPMNECLAMGVHLPWSQTRQVLQQAARLLEHRDVDESLLKSHRIWIDRRGRICLVDFLEPKTGASSLESTPVSLSSWKNVEHSDPLNPAHARCPLMGSLILDICALALSPSDRCRKKQLKCDVKPAPLPVESLLPRKARKLCQSVVNGKCMSSLSQFMAQIQQIAQGPNVVSSTTRFFNATLSLAFLTPLIVTAGILLVIPGLIFCADLSKSVRSVKTLEQLSELTSLSSHDATDWNGATEEEIAFYSSPLGRKQIQETVSALGERLQSSYRKLGWIEQSLYSQIPGLEHESEALPPFHLKSNKKDVAEVEKTEKGAVNPRNFRLNVGRQNIKFNESDNTWNDNRLRLAIDWVQKEQAVNSVQAGASLPVTERLRIGSDNDDQYVLLQIMLGMIAACVVWTWVTLGGIAQYFTGICFVRRDGRRIGFFRSGLRAVLLYLPVFVLSYWIFQWTLVDANDVFWTTQLKRLFLTLPFVYLATTLLRSNRTPLDMITNSAAIPR